ncbi:DUF975 family protein [Bacillus thuringiensis]|uniref:DUF975 family protein n=1 Tax=Bacillus thuringiensis TaxID=1428 RepID=UPI0021D69E7E|nr:DUF975 family protein [Bacillus thuringiensis]MCU7667790.1 DUF975 family protein [Bacillus thuringiensis]
MKFSELKTNALETIKPHKKTLYKGAGVVLLGWFLFLVVSLVFQDKGMKDAADNIDVLRDLLLYPIILANIAMIAKIYKGDTVKTSDALKNYSSLPRFGKALWAYILPALYVFLWTLPIIIIMLVIIAIAGISLTDVNSIGVGVGVIGSLAVLVIGVLGVSIVKSLQYGLNAYILGDNPNMSVNESITLSKELTKGYKRKYFLLSLSFIGWALLIPFTLGLILIWLIPYYNATVYEFYNHIKLEKAEENKNASDTEAVSTDENVKADETTDAE